MNGVLLVEGDYLSNLALNQYLREAGFEVEAVYSGLAALDAIKRAMPSNLVTAVDLGAGPDGLEVARYARRRRPDVRVVYMSSEPARFAPVDRDEASFVPKPCRGQQVVEALRRAQILPANA